MKVGIIELLVTGPVSDVRTLLYSRMFTRQYISIMPQVAAVWCRQLGHDPHYAVYYGQRDPLKLLPDDIDFIFISTYTQNSPLAYALAKLYKANGIRTAVAGPHAKAFPRDAARAFDYVVLDCDKDLVGDLLAGHCDRGIVTTGRPIRELPLARERDPEIRKALFTKSPNAFGVVP
jgi:hypothetical protein